MQTWSARSNVVLIGMPGSGKSTVGVLLAKILALPFIDTDLLIQAREKTHLQSLIDTRGAESFCDIEESVVCAMTARKSVIATGGSVVYRDRGMQHLRSHGIVVHLRVSLDTIVTRLIDIDQRGIVLPQQQSLAEMFAEREPLYQRYAHLSLACDDYNHNQVVSAVIEKLPASVEG